MDTLAIARHLRARGFSVIPVPRPRPGVESGRPGDGKTPTLAWGVYQRRLPTDVKLARWFGGAPMNLAVVTGAVSGVVVIDADDRDALHWCTRHLTYTPWQTRTGRGYHLWYRYPESRVASRVRLETGDGRLAIDVRGDGGYVIAPGSVHANGTHYAFAGDWSVPLDQVPHFWPGWLQRSTAPRPSRTHTPRPTGPIVERARRYLATMPRPEIGQGSDTATLCAAARLVRGFSLSAADAEGLLWEWAGGRPGWTREWIARKVANAARYGTEPIGGLVS